MRSSVCLPLIRACCSYVHPPLSAGQGERSSSLGGFYGRLFPATISPSPEVCSGCAACWVDGGHSDPPQQWEWASSPGKGWTWMAWSTPRPCQDLCSPPREARRLRAQEELHTVRWRGAAGVEGLGYGRGAAADANLDSPVPSGRSPCSRLPGSRSGRRTGSLSGAGSWSGSQAPPAGP